jgi:glutamate-1-semialdehyde 2,1-aminomutase
MADPRSGSGNAYSEYCGMKSFAASNEYVSAVHDLIPGGAHTYAKGDDQYPDGMAPVIERGAGCRVWDIDGNEYVEFGSGLRSNLLGHGFEPVVQAVRRWLEDGVNFVRPHRIEREAAERLIELIPSAEMVKFGLNGSDATTAAVRLARAYTGRDVVAVCRDQPFFSTDDWFIVTTSMSAGIPEAARHLTVQFSYNDLADLERLFGDHPGQIAAVVMEAETVQPPAPGYFDGLRRLCDRNGALLILDEIITGLRWHERGAQFVHGIEPDLSTFGKGIANGFPVSALVGRRDVMRLGGFVDDADRVFLLSQTGGAQPWALAAMLAVIDSCQRERIPDRLHEIGGELRRRIERVVADVGLSSYFQVRGRDCNLTYVARDRAGQPSQAFRTLVLQELIDRGTLAPSFVVCAAHDPAAIQQTVDAVADLMPVYQRALESGVDQVLRGRPVRPAIRARG